MSRQENLQRNLERKLKKEINEFKNSFESYEEAIKDEDTPIWVLDEMFESIEDHLKVVRKAHDAWIFSFN